MAGKWTFFFDTNLDNKKQEALQISQSTKQSKLCEAILTLQTYTDRDSINSFRCIGKIKHLKLLKSLANCDTLKHLGNYWNIDNLLIEYEKFTCAL